jgi:glutamine phosphoribosylpyrophosphate amidotransferase
VRVFPDDQRRAGVRGRRQPVHEQALKALHQHRGRRRGGAGAGAQQQRHQRRQQGVVDAVVAQQPLYALAGLVAGVVGVQAGAVQQVLRNGLRLLGVGAPERM